MPFDFARLKTEGRRAVHAVFGVQAFHWSPTTLVETEIVARLHTRSSLVGEIDEDGYPQYIQNVEKVVLLPGDYPELSFERGSVLRFPHVPISVMLDTADPPSGPLEQVWRVVTVKDAP